MNLKRPLAYLATTTVVVSSALSVAACGSKSSSNAAKTPSARGSSATVDLAQTTLGNILVDSKGKTLYLFQADTGRHSTCTGACAAAWPPLTTTGKPTAGDGLDEPLLGTSQRSDGKEQVTYNGHPLYLFTGDTAAGQANGEGSNGFGALWYVLGPNGKQITGSSGSTSAY
jgi:predicted lipoprotein with Yx(FWY)xxD motif